MGLTELGPAVRIEGEACVRPAVLPRALPLSVSCVAPTHLVLVTQAIWTDVLAPHPPTATPSLTGTLALPWPLLQVHPGQVGDFRGRVVLLTGTRDSVWKEQGLRAQPPRTLFTLAEDGVSFTL